MDGEGVTAGQEWVGGAWASPHGLRMVGLPHRQRRLFFMSGHYCPEYHSSSHADSSWMASS